MTPGTRSALDAVARLVGDARDAGTVGTRDDRRRVRPVAVALLEALTHGDGIEAARLTRKLARRAAGTPFEPRVVRFMAARSCDNPTREHGAGTISTREAGGNPLPGALSGSFGAVSVDLSGFSYEDRDRSGDTPGRQHPRRGEE
jgi:hypothetical protein